jgi:hypothetical protein
MLGSKAMKFSDLKLGFADATKELMFEPEIFEKAFWDPNDIMDKLLNSWKYILAGRKGVGKSAFSARIIRTANENKTIYAKNLMLNEFEYTTFAKASSDVNTVGAKRYVNAWNFVIMFQLYKYIYEEVEDKGIEKGIKSVVELLSRMKLPIELNFNKIVGAVSRLKMGVNVGVFDAEFESEFGHEPTSFAEKISSIVERMEKTLEKVSIEKKIYLLIDGVDDILRIKKNQIDILSSLLRSIDLINTHFVERKINIKVLLFIREDILTLVNDPDLNKIKRDGLINLSWSNKADDLMEIVELRLHYNKNIKMEEKLWNTFFPEELKGKPSWDYILEHTLYKPSIKVSK